ncbi:MULTISPECIES: hypothetical protein [Streptomyces]|uniref:hypothetical protein n=1 Tax=Streptomyces TaxID=1883 RepID=UPI000CD53204|nr:MULTISPECIES: hypothetical protein [Streptomyces]
MARDYDSQLLESVAVRRRRLRDALVFGPDRTRREADENTRKVLGGVALAAVLCAGCLGWSFISERFMGEGGGFGVRSMTAEPVPPVIAAPPATAVAPAMAVATPAVPGEDTERRAASAVTAR